MQTFEDRLLAELKHVVAANRPTEESRRRPRRRAGRRLVLAAGAVAVAAGTVIAVPALTEDKSARANAVERVPDGSIVVRLVEFTHPERVEQKLRAFGVTAKVDFLPFGTQCKGREFDGDFWMSDKPDTGVFGDDPGVDPHADEDMRGEVGTRIYPDKLKPGEMVVLDVWFQNTKDPTSASVLVPMVKKAGTVPACVRVPGGPHSGPDGGVGG
ncbi:hypothetical protein GCM10023195_16450 [Actinoallomurus liliacearum]|uniref:Uncharacterized protein n=1 Tax=Actinoallomurus liliacearum TaxID=1080073 RepID=A0ABP8TH19_9ACTN